MKRIEKHSDNLPNGLKLMIPGPVSVERHVLDKMSLPLVPHYGSEWAEFYHETISLFGRVQQTNGRIFLLVGSGSAGLDAAIGTASAVLPKILVLKNGHFGERLEEIARAYADIVSTLSFPFDVPIDPARVDDTLNHQPADLVLVTHCETSSGILNPIRELADACRRNNALLLVDAISSLGIEPLPMDEWGIALCVSASQKGLGAPPGLATVAISRAAWDRIRLGDSKGWYLNLTVWDRYERERTEWHPHPVTHAVGNVRALRAALQDVLHEGLPETYARHREVAAFLRRGLEDLGCVPAIPSDFASHGVTSVRSPCDKVETLLDCLRDNFGILVTGGLGMWKGKIFRIGHMGPAATLESINSLLPALGRALKMTLTQESRT